MSDIIHLKLVSGEEIIGTNTEDSNDANFFLKKVRTVQIQPLGGGQATIVFLPFLFGNPDAVVRISEKHVMGDPQEETPKALEDAYLQQTSNIAIAREAPPVPPQAGKIQL